MWKFDDDKSPAVITAEKHIKAGRKGSFESLPRTAILFYMGSGAEYTESRYKVTLITDRLPSFLNSRPVYRLEPYDICFLHGGWGAPMAADTVETLCALGVKNIVSVGMCGAFAKNVDAGDIIIPNKAFSEEGTSLHYYENTNSFYPNELLYSKSLECIKAAKALPVVTTDAVYRQTFYKEQMWRNMGAVGVDMETSALFSVGKYTGVNVVSILAVSDKHPTDSDNEPWKWKMTEETRYAFFEKCINFAKQV